MNNITPNNYKSNFEFMSFVATPNDKYGMLGIVAVRAYGKVILRYKMVNTKDGGNYFCPASYTIDEDSKKKYVQCFLLESRGDEELLIEQMREYVKQYKATAQPTFVPVQQMVQQALTQPATDIFIDEKLPF